MKKETLYKGNIVDVKYIFIRVYRSRLFLSNIRKQYQESIWLPIKGHFHLLGKLAQSFVFSLLEKEHILDHFK